MKTEHVNPFVAATANVFRRMLSCELTRGGLTFKNGFQPEFEISGIIGFSGNAAGTVVLSFSRQVAFAATGAMTGEEPADLSAEVTDVVGELTNMVAGGAKAKLEELAMSVSLPSVVVGKNHSIAYPSSVQPIYVPFDSSMGPFSVEFGLVEKTEDVLTSSP